MSASVSEVSNGAAGKSAGPFFSVDARDPGTRARTGTLRLGHGDVATPVFMPVGTQATVKALRHAEVDELGYRLILANAYHLYLRPGMEVIRNAGGLHRFSSWNRNILTDSGGYQVFSLAPFRRIKDEGIRFRSHVDGSYHMLTPEAVVDIQLELGSDILMPLDVCTPPAIPEKEAADAVKKTSSWAARSRERWSSREGETGALFAIVQGNFYPELRRRSAEELCALDLPGMAIGGLSVGESFEQFRELLSFTVSLLPDLKPRYVMGIGTPDYILEAVENGVDMFDCVYPTRAARNGTVLTWNGSLNLRNEKFKMDTKPIDPDCGCGVCRTYTRSFLRHLINSGEMLAPMLATEHNLFFLHEFMERVRNSIYEGVYGEFKRRYFGLFRKKKVQTSE